MCDFSFVNYLETVEGGEDFLGVDFDQLFDSTGFFTKLMCELFDTKHLEDRYEITWKQLREGSMNPLMLTWVNICLHWLLLLSRVQGSSPCPTMFTLQHLRTVMDKKPLKLTG